MWDVDHSFLQVMFSRETAKISLVGRGESLRRWGSYYPEGLADAPGDELPQTSTSSVLSDILGFHGNFISQGVQKWGLRM